MAFDPFAALYDPLMRPLEATVLRGWRRETLSHLKGEVLEVGVGTGANFGLYPAGVRLVGLEPSAAMRVRAQRHARRLGQEIDLVDGRVEGLPFEAGRFDTVLSTLVFCAVPDPVAGLRELHRVLKPGGQLVMLEHTKSCRRCLNLLLTALTAVTGPTMGEHFDRDTASCLIPAGFEPLENRLLGLEVFHLIRGRRG